MKIPQCKLNIPVTMAGITKWLGYTIHNIT